MIHAAQNIHPGYDFYLPEENNGQQYVVVADGFRIKAEELIPKLAAEKSAEQQPLTADQKLLELLRARLRPILDELNAEAGCLVISRDNQSITLGIGFTLNSAREALCTAIYHIESNARAAETLE